MEGRILIIEDNPVNSGVLKDRFEEEGLQVEVAMTGAEGIAIAARSLPQAIIISTTLPDMPGTAVAQRLRQIARTQHIFQMLLADRESHVELLVGLEQGADDFVTIPFDPLEVSLRVRNALRRAGASNMLDPTTGLPTGRVIQNHLRKLLNDPQGAWTLMRVKVNGLEAFRDVYGFQAGGDFLRSVTLILAEALSLDDVLDDFLGYNGNDDFIIVTEQRRADSLAAEVRTRFDLVLRTHYSFMDLAQGYLLIDGEQAQMATVRITRVDATSGPFYDIRALSEALV
ncbi:MAG: Aerobic respiration control protein ArcA [Chloroflexi bacterium ADurb.Bin360]|nr:MAG: Aerobic respiration control protein ArcA [Chloroflexi bacterium ADurb.Bin360]